MREAVCTTRAKRFKLLRTLAYHIIHKMHFLASLRTVVPFTRGFAAGAATLLPKLELNLVR